MATAAWRHWLAAAADVVWPRCCLVCDQPNPDESPDCPVCADCRAILTADPAQKCPRCSSTVGPHTDVSKGCSRCRGSTFRFASAVRLGPYDGERKSAVLRMKESAGEPLAEALGEVWAAARRDELTAGNPGVVVPVPLHWRRKWDRGYNQAEALARGIADGLGLPCRPGAAVRTRPTPTQRAQTPTERWENVKNAFRPGRHAGVSGMTVLLIDDVMTTGATADAAAIALLAAGAAQVRLAVLAHG
ncbi:MAG: ComF family protein [Fimbriiglobus sp.]